MNEWRHLKTSHCICFAGGMSVCPDNIRRAVVPCMNLRIAAIVPGIGNTEVAAVDGGGVSGIRQQNDRACIFQYGAFDPAGWIIVVVVPPAIVIGAYSQIVIAVTDPCISPVGLRCFDEIVPIGEIGRQVRAQIKSAVLQIIVFMEIPRP